MDSGPYFNAERQQHCLPATKLRSSVLCKEAALELGYAYQKKLTNSKNQAGCYYKGAAENIGYTYQYSIEYSHYPTGCFYTIFGKVYFKCHLNDSTTIRHADQGELCHIG